MDAGDRAAILAVLDEAGSTRAAVQRALAREPIACGHQARLRHLHYPGSGRKAAQVNYAAVQVETTAHDYLPVYDVDSRPDVALVTVTMDLIRARTAEGRRPQVVQQPSVFLPDRNSGGSASMLGSGAALVQTPVDTAARDSRAASLHPLLSVPPTLGSVADCRARPGRAGRRIRPLRRAARADPPGRPGVRVRRECSRDRRGCDARGHGRLVSRSGPGGDRAAPPLVRRISRLPGQFWRACRAGAPPIACVTALTVGGYRAGMWLAAGPATAACTLALVHPRSGASTRLLAGAALAVGCAAPLPLEARHRPTAAQLALSPHPVSLVRAAGQVWMAYLIRSVGPAAALATAWRVEPDGLAGRTARRTAGAGR